MKREYTTVSKAPKHHGTVPLKPCPFCGETNIYRHGELLYGLVRMGIVCGKCGASIRVQVTSTASQAQAIATRRWNRRAQLGDWRKNHNEHEA